MALTNIDPRHAGILPIIVRALNEPNQKLRAINALDRMGLSARPAVPSVEHLIATDVDTDDDYNAPERAAAVTALGQIGGISVVPALAAAMNRDKEQRVQVAATTALGVLGSNSNQAISALVSAFDNDSETLRAAASDALSKLGRPALPALIAALKSSHVYQRAYAVETLSQITPFPDAATHALTLALHDKSDIVRAEAAAALKGNKVDAGTAIKDQQADEDFNIDDAQTTDRGQDLDSLVAGKAAGDTRIYSKAEIIARIAPDNNHEYPSELKYLVAVIQSGVPATDAKFLVTVHAAKDGVERLAVWKKLGDDKYKRLLLQEASSENHFAKPEVFSSRVLVTGRGAGYYETGLFLNLPVDRVWGDGAGVDDAVFVVDRDELRPVAIAADEAGSKQMRADETTWLGSFGNKFSDNDLEFGFGVWKKNACHACPEAVEVVGTYKVLKEMHYEPQKKAWVPNWKMVADTAKREPSPR